MGRPGGPVAETKRVARDLTCELLWIPQPHVIELRYVGFLSSTVLNPELSSADTSSPSTPEDHYTVSVRIKLPGKRKIQDMEVEDTLSHKALSVPFCASCSG